MAVMLMILSLWVLKSPVTEVVGSPGSGSAERTKVKDIVLAVRVPAWGERPNIALNSIRTNSSMMKNQSDSLISDGYR